MKRWLTGFGVLLILGIVAAVPAQEKAPAIIFETDTKDFGKVSEGETLKHVFTFTNKGNAALEILKVESS